ncbi:MAG: hypothetical protein JO197_05165 [Acidobacteria bacterium]|nr:hypothetical protein [Acidobacteriota bacterium]MBV9477203.1 hypothetical protein [Acidobacteriota bacterium]
MRSHVRVVLLFLAVALAYAGLGLLPGRTFAPLDLPLDAGAWKPDPTQRIRVSNTLLGDVVVQFVAWDREITHLLARGELPWTNRWAGDGGPLFANPQTALFSPFTWPRLLFGLKGWALTAILKLLAAALCAYWFARELDVPREQALVCGFVYATAGYTIVWLLYPITNVFALLAGLAAAALRLMKTPSIRNALLVLVFAALCTAGGHPESLFIGAIGIWIFLSWEAERRREFGGLSAIIPSTVGAFLGFAILAVQLAPFLTILGDSYAGELRPRLPHPFRIWGVVSQVLPGVLGTPLRGELDLTALPVAENFNLRAGGFIGAIVLLAIVLAWRQLAPALRRGLVIGSVALVLSWYPPGLWSVLRHVPVLRVLTLEYGVLLFVLFGAMAGGPAIAFAATRRRRKIGAALAIVGLLAVITGVFPLLPGAHATLTRVARGGIEQLRARGHLQQAPAVYEARLAYYLDAAGLTTVRRLAIPGACWLVAGLALALPLRRRAALLTLAAAGELLSFGIGFNPAVRMDAIPPEPPVVTALKQLDPARQSLIAEHFEVFPANLATLYQVRDVISYDALTTKARVAQLLPAGYDPLLHTFNPMLAPDETRALASLGVRYVLSRVDVPNARRVAGPPAPAVGIYELENAPPVPLPANHHPTGLYAGIVISLIALFLSAVWLHLFTLEAPTMQQFESRAS